MIPSRARRWNSLLFILLHSAKHVKFKYWGPYIVQRITVNRVLSRRHRQPHPEALKHLRVPQRERCPACQSFRRGSFLAAALHALRDAPADLD